MTLKRPPHPLASVRVLSPKSGEREEKCAGDGLVSHLQTLQVFPKTKRRPG